MLMKVVEIGERKVQKRFLKQLGSSLFVLVLSGYYGLSNAAESNGEITDIKSLVVEGELLRNKGNLIEAQKVFGVALELASKNKQDINSYAAAEIATGYNLSLLSRTTEAEEKLLEAFNVTASSEPYLHVLAGQYLASLYLSEGENEKAQQYIDEVLKIAAEKHYSALEQSLALLRVSTIESDKNTKIDKLLSIEADVRGLPQDSNKASLQLSLSQKLIELDLSDLSAEQRTKINQVAYKLLEQTQQFAINNAGYDRLNAESTATLAKLYVNQGRNEEALLLVDRAINLAKSANATELTIQLEAQKGSLFKKQGDNDRALFAYESAVKDLYAIQADMPINLPDGSSTINKIIDPIYREYAGLLLQSNLNESGLSEQQKIGKAIDSMEAVKEADLQDFFLGRCSISSANTFDWREMPLFDAVIVYPILHDDRIDIILKSQNGVLKRSVQADKNEVKKAIDELSISLQMGKDFRRSAKQLYDWIYLPVKEDLDKLNLKTIVYVPDRSLRAVPFSALFDGNQFIVEHHSVVTLPSLKLQVFNNRNNRGGVTKLLTAGLSRPDGGSVDTLPKNIINKVTGRGVTRAVDTTQPDRSKLIEELSLPNVEAEVNAITANKTNTKTLLNNQFTKSALQDDIQSGEFDKVHIASHGYFGKNAKDSFIMAYDQNLTLLDLQNSLGSTESNKAPIDLLTLSACETAQGDDRMLLGFSGIAVKSNVLSAVGSLWSINDEAALEFMKLFYDGLNKSLNKAQAMQQAQVEMLKSKKYRHPFYWAPFILIGNWQ